MSEDDPEAEIIRLARRQMERRKVVLIPLMILLVLLSAAVGFAGFRWLHNDPTLMVLFVLVGGAAGGCMVAIPVLLYPMPRAAFTRRIWRRRTDEVQRGLTRFCFFVPCALLPMALVSFDATLHVLTGRGQVAEVVGAGGVAIGALSYLAIIMGWGAAKGSKVVYDEELFQSFRARGLRNGLWTMMIGVCAVFGLGLYRPLWGLSALPAVLFVSISVIALTIAILSRRADRDA